MDAVALRDRIDKMAITTLMLFVSPSLLAVNKKSGKPSTWICFIQKIVDCGHMPLLYIDEAHYVQQQKMGGISGQSFSQPWITLRRMPTSLPTARLIFVAKYFFAAYNALCKVIMVCIGTYV